MKLHETKTYQRIAAWTKRHEKYWIPLMLVGGLSADLVQFSALDLREKFTIQAIYVVVATGALLIIHYPKAVEARWFNNLRLAALFSHQFAVGGLLATSLLFYWFSGTLSVSWPILLLVAAFMLSNEFLREHFLRPTVQVAVLSFSLFSILSIVFSFAFDSFEPVTFVEAGIASLAFMVVYVTILARVDKLTHRLKPLLAVCVGVFALMLGAYFLDVIPPIPLSIRDAGIYHDVVRVNGDYQLTGENEAWWQKLWPVQTLHVKPADSLFAYTAIFAPADLSTTIVHKWEFRDPTTHKWVTEATIPFSITGGRQQGYRGYSRLSHLMSGSWRVSVETTRGQVLGRINFTVINS